jgi:hypothetical protein
MLLNGIPLVLKKISGGRIVPPEYEKAEPWVIPPGGIVPRWVYVLLRYLISLSCFLFPFLFYTVCLNVCLTPSHRPKAIKLKSRYLGGASHETEDVPVKADSGSGSSINEKEAADPVPAPATSST